MFKHQFVGFFKALTPGDRGSLREWLRPESDGTNRVVERFIESAGFNPWNDDSFGNHIHSYLNDDPARFECLHLAYNRLEILAKEDALCREAEIASVQEDVDGTLTTLEDGTRRLVMLYSRLLAAKGIHSYPADQLHRLEEALRALSRSSLTLIEDFP